MKVEMSSNEYAKNPKIVDGILKYLGKLHEKNPKDPLFLDNLVVPVNLEVGDYKYNNVLIEHKALSNYFGDVQSGHVFQQAQDMLYTRIQFPDIHLYILISGDIADVFKQPFGKYQGEAMIAAWASLNTMGITTSFVGNQWFFIHGMIDLFVKHNDGKERIYNPVRKPVELEHMVLTNYCAIKWLTEKGRTDGVGETTARRLAEKFRAPKDLYSASVEDLMKIEGIGRPTAEKMVAFFEGRAV